MLVTTKFLQDPVLVPDPTSRGRETKAGAHLVTKELGREGGLAKRRGAARLLYLTARPPGWSRARPRAGEVRPALEALVAGRDLF